MLLEREKPAGVRYASFKLEDGVSFVHIVSVEPADGRSPLPDLSAFRTFTAHIKDRCEEPPVAVDLEEIGSYRFFRGVNVRACAHDDALQAIRTPDECG